MIGGSMKSLFKSGIRDLKNKFADPGGDDEFATPLGLRMGAAVDIDTLPMRMHADILHIKPPEQAIVIVAQGYVDLGDGTYLHRYYAADETMIQVLTVAGMSDEHVEEITYYAPYKSYYPGNEGEWALWTATGGRMGAPDFRLDDGTEYTRLWFDTTSGHAEPVEFTEEVYEDPDTDDHRDSFQKTMLYGRNIEDGKKNEYLLITVESYNGEKTVELMMGVDIEFAMLKVI